MDFSTFKDLFAPAGASFFRENEALKTVFETDARLAVCAEWWRGTPLDAKGLYLNLGEPMVHDFRKFLRWQTSPNPQKKEKKAETWRHQILRNTDFLESNTDGIIWLGHASFFLRINGLNLLIDPVFGGMPFVPRFSELPFSPDKLPALDYVLLSHNHRDHADAPSFRRLMRDSKNRKTEILTGLSMEKLVKSWTYGQKIQTAGWWQQFELKNSDLSITFTPSQHWARRGLTDLNEMLWGGFMIESKKNDLEKQTIYFAGDSGLSPVFALVGAVFPHIDIAMIGCGAYKPDYIMKSNHTSPSEALEAARLCGTKMLLPMHYGTFDLSDESLGEPFRHLTELKKVEKQVNINLLKIGESLQL